jgi:hypothetical protein
MLPVHDRGRHGNAAIRLRIAPIVTGAREVRMVRAPRRIVPAVHEDRHPIGRIRGCLGTTSAPNRYHRYRDKNPRRLNFGKAWQMTRFLLAGAAALGVMSGAAMAQTSTSETVTTTTSPLPPPLPVTVSSSSTTGGAVLPDGDQTSTSGTSSVDSSGNRTETSITNTSYPLSAMITTTRKTTRISNGQATETTTVTNTWPAAYGRPPDVATSTRTYNVSSN